MSANFDYDAAFSRNIGWVTREEQQVLRNKCVAIAGLGGVGGSHLLTLTRMGIGSFNIADLDSFELANFNRQAGASLSSLGRPKIEVLAALARDINPEVDIRLFGQGVTQDNLAAFLERADVYVDGLDFFAVAIRRRVFDACARLGLAAITAAPLGMGVALLNFLPGRMTFEEYFRLDGQPEAEQLLRFLLGLSPSMLQRGYLVDPSAVDLVRHRGPSTPMACELCAGVAASQVVKILLNRGPVPTAPHGLQFDAYRNKSAHTWRPGGNNHPLQRLGLALARRRFSRTATGSEPAPVAAQAQDTLHQILDLARWAPSGDNTQPWRFEIRDDRHVTVHGRDTREHCVYDLQGHASQIALGALLETLNLAASRHGWSMEVERRIEMDEAHPTFDVAFDDSARISPDPLSPFIQIRSTQRRALTARPLTPAQRDTLEEAVAPSHRLVWLEGGASKSKVAGLLFHNAGIRLTIPEAYEVHRSIIEWRTSRSEDRIPDEAIGLDPLSTRLMQWAMQSWRRVAFMNRYLGGTWLPRLELDVVPALRCAAHFVIVAEQPAQSIDDFVAAGRKVQRFWLTATRLGLQLQPEMTPLIFASYVRAGLHFSAVDGAQSRAEAVARRLDELIGAQNSAQAVFMGRIGYGPAPRARSTRRPLQQLIITPADPT